MLLMTIIFFLMFLIFQVLYMVVPLFNMKKVKLDKSIEEKGITVIIPAYNEELVIKNCINSSLAIDYSNYEILIVNDGSKDSTMDLLKEYLKLEECTKKRANKLDYKYVRAVYKSAIYNNVYLIDKDNGGKADALNAGIDYSSNELVVTLDADSMLEKDSLRYMNQYFEDTSIVAAGGTVNVVQGVEVTGDDIICKFKGNNIIKHQMLHYIHGFYVKKNTQSVFNSMIVISGAFGIFKKDMLFNVDGFRHTVGEDMDITLKIHKYIKENNLNKRLVYAPEAICYTECPDNFKNFYNQRIRWQKAFIDCVVEYWGSLFNKLQGSLSAFMAFDGFLLGTISVFFTLLVPVVLILTGEGYMVAIILLLTAVIFDYLQNIIALIVCRRYGMKFSVLDYIKIFFFMFYERFTYKLIPLVLNSVGTIRYFLDDDRWSYIERKGDVSIV